MMEGSPAPFPLLVGLLMLVFVVAFAVTYYIDQTRPDPQPDNAIPMW